MPPFRQVEPFFVLELISFTRKGYWIRVGDQFAYAIGREPSEIDESIGKTLLESLDPDQTEKVLEYIGIIGTLQDSGSEGPRWLINRSIHPALVGCELVGSSAKPSSLCSSYCQRDDSDPQIIHQRSLHGDGKRSWKILDLSDEGAVQGLWKKDSTNKPA